ncbi:MAG TPA: sugar ABC transporter substrate-binding protein [Polyangia bacterium]|jgi:ribose transport system substrate-binding protein|nr:sugar ABC transporter substrate-binding protein [Polyangia bacterium]
MRKRNWSAVAVAFLVNSAGCNKQSEAPAPAPTPAKTEEAPKPAAASDDGNLGPKVVPGPGYLPECFAPWSKDTKYLQWPAKKPPFRIALVNGYVGNAWRIQMVKTAKAFAKDPAVAPLLKEFKVVSTGTDIAAQLGAIEDFINQGYDGIVTLAVSPEGFDRVIRLADKKGVIIVPFDNVLDTDKVMEVNEDQLSMGKQWGEFLDKILKGRGKVLEVRGLQGNSTERDRHAGFHQIMDGKKYEITEVVGSWDDGKAQKAVADALAVHHKFDAMMVQGGSTGAIRALLDAGHKPIPVATEAENGARKLIAKYHTKGMKGLSLGQSPGLAAIAMKAVIEGLQGKVLPQKISVPIPAADDTTLKDGDNYYSKLSDNFFTPNEFPPCGVNISGVKIMNESETDVK